MSGDSVRVASPLFPVEGQGSIPMSPLQFEIEIIPTQKAIELNKLWHSRLPKLPIWNVVTKHGISFGASYKNIYFAIAIWSRPIARALDDKFTFELRRMAIHVDAPKNTASRMISIMCKIIKKRTNYRRLISYQDTKVHNGTIYKASGWIATNTSKGVSWFKPRKNLALTQQSGIENLQTDAPKIRWEKQIRPEPETKIIAIKPPKKTSQKGLFF